MLEPHLTPCGSVELRPQYDAESALPLIEPGQFAEPDKRNQPL